MNRLKAINITMRLATDHSENRTQKLESATLDYAIDQENYLFFQVGFDARYRHWVAYQLR